MGSWLLRLVTGARKTLQTEYGFFGTAHNARYPVQGTCAAGVPLFCMARVLDPGATTVLEREVTQMVRRLADQLDQVVDPRADDRAVVSEALIRLALAVYVNSQGTEETRDRLMTFALTLTTPATVH